MMCNHNCQFLLDGEILRELVESIYGFIHEGTSSDDSYGA